MQRKLTKTNCGVFITSILVINPQLEFFRICFNESDNFLISKMGIECIPVNCRRTKLAAVIEAGHSSLNKPEITVKEYIEK